MKELTAPGPALGWLRQRNVASWVQWVGRREEATLCIICLSETCSFRHLWELASPGRGSLSPARKGPLYFKRSKHGNHDPDGLAPSLSVTVKNLVFGVDGASQKPPLKKSGINAAHSYSEFSVTLSTYSKSTEGRETLFLAVHVPCVPLSCHSWLTSSEITIRM